MRNYKEFLKDIYQYRVDEIVDEINTNDKTLVEFNKEKYEIYEELKSTLNDKEKQLLLQYSDYNDDILTYERYAISKRIYEDLER